VIYGPQDPAKHGHPEKEDEPSERA
jgi:hypothetical protein